MHAAGQSHEIFGIHPLGHWLGNVKGAEGGARGGGVWAGGGGAACKVYDETFELYWSAVAFRAEHNKTLSCTPIAKGGNIYGGMLLNAAPSGIDIVTAATAACMCTHPFEDCCVFPGDNALGIQASCIFFVLLSASITTPSNTEPCQHRVLARGNRVLARGNRVLARGNRVVARGNRVLARGNRLLARGNRLQARGDRLLARGDKVLARSDKLSQLQVSRDRLPAKRVLAACDR